MTVVTVAFALLVGGMALWLLIRPKLSKEPPRTLKGGMRAAWTPDEYLSPESVKLRDWMTRTTEPAFAMIDREGRGFSKLGGHPSLPACIQWPLTSVGPRQFFMQIDFAELPWGGSRRSDWIPENGRLWVFFRYENPDRKDTIEVIYAGDDLPLEEVSAPSGTFTYPEIPIAFQKFRAAPGSDWLGPVTQPLRNKNGDLNLQQEAGGYTFPYFKDVAHYVGGYPAEEHAPWPPVDAELALRNPDSPISVRWSEKSKLDQSVEEASGDWRMLLQIDSDHRMRWNWADRGRVYVMIRREDAKRRDFSQTITLTEFT